MIRSRKRSDKLRRNTTVASAAKPGQKSLLTKASSEAAHHVPPRPQQQWGRAPASPLMISPLQGWRQLCERTGGTIHYAVFYDWIKEQRIYSIRMGGRIFIPIAALEEFIQRCLRGDEW